MHISEYRKENIPTLLERIEKIKSNKNVGFIWPVVRNDKGNLLDLGGRNTDKGLYVKIYVPDYDENDNL